MRKISYNKEIDNAFRESYITLLTESLQIENRYPSLIESDQKKIQESLSVTLIISMLLAAPNLVKTLAKGVRFILQKLKIIKSDSNFLEGFIQFADQWHHKYILIIEKLLTYSGVFKAAGIAKDDESREKIATVVYYVIIFGFGIHGGISSAKSIWSIIAHGHYHHINMAVLESVLTSIKSKEVADFISNIS